MATFQLRVEEYLAEAIGNLPGTPTEVHMTDVLRDGVKDVTRRWLEYSPQDADKFMAVTTAQTANGADLNGAQIISVVRADGVSATNLRECIKYLQVCKEML